MSSSVVELLYNHSKTFPDKPAFIINDEVISYRTLFSSIVLFKDILKDKGIKRGDYVIIRACHSVGYWVSLLSLCLLEAISIPLEKDLKDETIVEINEKVKGVKLIISSKEEKDILIYSDESSNIIKKVRHNIQSIDDIFKLIGLENPKNV